MRIILFFDLPTKTSADKRNYRYFKRDLINEGFIMMQESVYCKLVMNYSAAEIFLAKIKKISPKKGLIQCMCITEKQYTDIHSIIGERSSSKLSSTDRLIIL